MLFSRLKLGRLGHLSYSISAVALALSLLGNIIAAFYQFDTIFGLTAKTYSYVDGDHPRRLPLKIPTANMIFQNKMDHFGMDKSARTWGEWSTMRPREAGYVYLGKTHLPIDLNLWHSVHCLSHIRSLISSGDDASDHSLHCVHYLRQGILCAADSTLEERPSKSFDADGNEIFPGDGATHTCRDFEYIYQWNMKHRESWTPEMVQRFSEVGSGHGGHQGHQMMGNGSMSIM
ncbi:hypothetical protein VKT23_020327 [Stygiomarasmius scandens]|uniref:Uncharacterized protein n=1 Tax=Marasmiellus scandens TaxID=2682957 RepID=A0ABR1IKK6_9AGAR